MANNPQEFGIYTQFKVDEQKVVRLGKQDGLFKGSWLSYNPGEASWGRWLDLEETNFFPSSRAEQMKMLEDLFQRFFKEVKEIERTTGPDPNSGLAP